MTLYEKISRRKEEVQLLVSSDNLQKAMRRLMDFVRDFSPNADHLQQVIQFNVKFNELKSDQHEIGGEESSFLLSLLQFLDDVEEYILNLANPKNN